MKVQTQAHEVTEAIASRDGNNLYVTSSFFGDPLKYRAFCAYYAVMRVVDDRIDNLPSPGSRCAEVRKRELGVVEAWERVVRSSYHGIYPMASLLASCDFAEAEAVCESLIASYRVFPVPMRLWTNFFAAMRSDLVASEFVHWSDFLAYAEGATVAPTTIYLSLIVARRDVKQDSCEFPRGFNLYDCGRHLGLFAYLGHIIRDLAEDITRPATRLCLAREDMLAHGVSPEILRSEALNRRASPATRRLVGELLQRARWHLAQGRALAVPIHGFLDCDSRFILELIITMYEHIIAKIESTGCDPMEKRHHLTRREQAEIIHQVAARTGFLLPD
ncbi:MAG: squalene/phytoene synthase family protein [Deltaproteobacteria bacterium]|nr:MAG: squalene/phytoene synthase family protein [Deltaproteobacteria bacterium]